MSNVIDERGTSPGTANHWHKGTIGLELYVSIDTRGSTPTWPSLMVDVTSIIVSTELRLLVCRPWSKDVWDGEVDWRRRQEHISVLISPEGEG